MGDGAGLQSVLSVGDRTQNQTRAHADRVAKSGKRCALDLRRALCKKLKNVRRMVLLIGENSDSIGQVVVDACTAATTDPFWCKRTALRFAQTHATKLSPNQLEALLALGIDPTIPPEALTGHPVQAHDATPPATAVTLPDSPASPTAGSPVESRETQPETHTGALTASTNAAAWAAQCGQFKSIGLAFPPPDTPGVHDDLACPFCVVLTALDTCVCAGEIAYAPPVLFACVVCGIRHAIQRKRAEHFARDAGRAHNCLCTTTFQYQDARSKDSDTTFKNLHTYVNARVPHTRILTSYDAFRRVPGNLLLQCARCESRRRVAVRELFGPLPPCSCCVLD